MGSAIGRDGSHEVSRGMASAFRSSVRTSRIGSAILDIVDALGVDAHAADPLLTSGTSSWSRGGQKSFSREMDSSFARALFFRNVVDGGRLQREMCASALNIDLPRPPRV